MFGQTNSGARLMAYPNKNVQRKLYGVISL